MRVALDATPLTLNTGGIARYVRELSRALALEFPADDVLLLSDQRFEPPPACPSNLRTGLPPRRWIEERWWLYGVSRESSRFRAEVFHGTHFVVPWLPLRPAVMTLHDLSPWLDPAWRQDAEFVRRRAPILLGLGLATMVITPSRAVKREVISHFGLHPDRVHAVPLAANAHFHPAPPAAPAAPYFLYLGALEARKNINMLVQAWREVRRRLPVDLLLAGRVCGGSSPPADEPGLRLLGEVPDQDLPSLYSAAAAVLYPSLYEGFGLPVLEAMQCGALVLASRDPAIMEVAGDGAILLDSGDASGWAAAMHGAVARPGD
ncbi:MAG TPA: glycosyltransferase family 1 protein, partial [Bryobacteraceae bacterium]|nr:glycosyltransferase family 1 protein [Bryobacteraceae bacterium]